MLWRGPIGGGAASGKVGALVASRAKTTQYLKARVNTGRKIGTAFQDAIRNAMKSVVAYWKNLTQNQRDAWETYAQNVTITNRLGDSVKISGNNWFVGNNVARQQMANGSAPIVTTAPTIFDHGNLPLDGSTLVAGGTNGTLTLNEAPSAMGITSDDIIGLYVGRPYSAGRSKYYGSKQLALAIRGNSTNESFTFTLPFGDAGTSGKLAADIRISRADGRLSSPFAL